MSARRTWILSGLLSLTLAACAGASPTPTTPPPTIPAVTAVTPAVKANAESFWLESREGTVIVELQPLNLAESEAAPNGQWTYRVALTESGMDAPPLTQVYDLTQLVYLTGPNGKQVSPTSWAVSEEGHMGHHVKGTLTFPKDGPTKVLKIVIRDVGGVSERVFEWSVP